ncbi:MAG: hypothetical protein NTY17_10470, partial [Planctomycetia bacterium]|nr:hypothetical protein [Planctomycetia bacterium]
MAEFVNSLYRGFISLPVGISVSLIVATLTAMTLAIVVWTGRRDLNLRANDNVSSASIRLVGGAFIFLCSFSTALVWQESTHLSGAAGHEFGAASSVMNSLAAQRIPEAIPVMTTLREYATIVADEELVNAHSIAGADGANELLVSATDAIITLANADKLNSEDVKVLLDALSVMSVSRHDRLSQPYPTLPLPVFVLGVGLGVLTTIVAAAYPSGPDRQTKWLQALTALAVVASLLSTGVFLLNGESGWMREDRHRPAQVFVAEFSDP